MKVELKIGKCGLCGNPNDEGFEIKLFWFIKGFICEACWSKLFKQFTKAR
jgi:hypothetical protein